MPSKLFNDEPNYDNDEDTLLLQKPPSYQMQTISSRLKIVVKDNCHQRNDFDIPPFTVGSSFSTHNVKLLKQETLKKLKTIMLSYKNEDDINCRNINELRLLKYDIDTYRIESLKLKYFTSRRKHFVNSARYRLFNRAEERQNFKQYSEEPDSPKRQVRQILNVCYPGNSEQELTTLFRLHSQLENIISDNNKPTLNTKAKTDVHIEAEKPVEDASLFQSNVKSYERHYPPGIKQSEISIGGQNSLSSKASHKKEKKRRTKRHYVEQIQEMQREIVENEEEYTNRIADLKEKLKLSGETPRLNLSDNLSVFDFCEPDKKPYAPSIYSRRKRRKHLTSRRYITSELDENIPLEQNEDELLTENKLVAEDSEETVSTRSFAIKHEHKDNFENENFTENRPASQPL